MFHLRFSLFTKIILWFFLNLLLLAAISVFLLNFRFDSRSRFFGAANRIEAVTRSLEDELNGKTRAERDAILQKYSETHQVEFFFFDAAGKQIGGRETDLPAAVFTEITTESAPFAERRRLPNNLPTNLPPPILPRAPPSVFVQTKNPPLYWFVGRMMTFDADKPEAARTRLLAASDSFTGRGLFFDPLPYILIIGVVIGISILFWFPFVRRITNNIAQLTSATEHIAEERFDIQVSEKRTDELGRLGKAINSLAARLNGFVSGQKRFLGDISHELNSPLARMQFALTILEDRVDETNLSYVADVREEVELMTKLVGELLAFSKAGIKTTNVKLETVRLRPLIIGVVEREVIEENARIKVDVPENATVTAEPDLLTRAVANVVRNAVRYAGDAGEIVVAAAQNDGETTMTITDNGAGVPEPELEKLFDPFYRVAADRARSTGGTGLGLAIVKSCVEACQGKVFARNRQPHGLEIVIVIGSR